MMTQPANINNNDDSTVARSDTVAVSVATAAEDVKIELAVEAEDCVTCSTSCETTNRLRCKKGHALCEICAESFLKMILAEPDGQLPPKCTSCGEEFENESLDAMVRFLKIDETFHRLLTKNALSSALCENNETLVECPFCDYLEIRDSSGLNFIFCGNPVCRKVSCFYCHLECNMEAEGTDSEEEEIMKHFECALHGRVKTQIDDAIENGLKVSCPYCKTGGRKDEDTCTHMSCVKCSRYYCYVCGLACEKFEGGDPSLQEDNFSIHNDEWHKLHTRCPMYFADILAYDDRWPDSGYEPELLDFFHRKKILQNLRSVLECHDLELVKQLEEKYKWLAKAQLTIDEILQEDLAIIQRHDNERES